MLTLGGNVSVRNGIELDYCFVEAIKSLLPVCDEVVVCDGESTDGTQELIREWMRHEPRIKLCVYPWKHPKGDIGFWVDWLNFTREHIKSDLHIQLDADEILSESSYQEVIAHKSEASKDVSLWCKRYNFWRDAKSLIPHGVCLSHRVVRIAPSDVWLPSDGPDQRGHKAVSMAIPSGVEIFHYGFLRRKESFFKKARQLQEFFFNGYDSRLDAVERKLILDGDNCSGNWMQEIKNVSWINDLIPFNGTHPKLGVKWLKDRGYDT